VYAVAIMGFDVLCSRESNCPSIKLGVLHRIVFGLFDDLCSRQSELIEGDVKKYGGGIAIFLEVFKRMNRSNEFQNLSIPEVKLSDVVHFPAPWLLLLSSGLEDLIARKAEECDDKYEIVNHYDGIKKGLYPVSIAIKKNGEVIEFVEVDASSDYDKESGSIKLRRSKQLKEYLYRYDYPDIPFVRIDMKNIISENVPNIANYCLSQIKGFH
jgi:hypothetical protein